MKGLRLKHQILLPVILVGALASVGLLRAAPPAPTPTRDARGQGREPQASPCTSEGIGEAISVSNARYITLDTNLEDEGFDFLTKIVYVSPDGKLLITWERDGGDIQLWDTARRQVSATVAERAESGWMPPFTFSPEKCVLAVAHTDQTVRLWDVASGTERAVLEGHTDRLLSLAFSPDGTLLASGSWDGTVRLWDVASGTERAVLEGSADAVDSLAFTSDGTLLASASFDDTVRLWDVASGTERAVLKGSADWCWGTRLAFGVDGRLLASKGRYGPSAYVVGAPTVRLWDVAGQQQVRALEDTSDFAFSPDGSRLVTWGKGPARLWNGASGQLVRELGVAASAAFSPDGSRLATWGNGPAPLWNARLWNGVSGQLVRELGIAASAAFSPDGSLLVTGGVGLWDAASGLQIVALDTPTEVGAFSPDGSLLVMVGQRVQVWRVGKAN